MTMVQGVQHRLLIGLLSILLISIGCDKNVVSAFSSTKSSSKSNSMTRISKGSVAGKVIQNRLAHVPLYASVGDDYGSHEKRKKFGLFQSPSRQQQQHGGGKFFLQKRINHFGQIFRNMRSVTMNKVRRALVVFSTVALLWFGSANIQKPTCHASDAMSRTEATSRVLLCSTKSSASTSYTPMLSPSLEKMIDKYVEDHMFDDDVYDPIESAYIEAYDDASTGSYPRKLRDLTSNVLGSDGLKVNKDLSGGVSKNGPNIGDILLVSIKTLQKRLGLSESAAIIVIASLFVIAGPSVFLLVGMIIGGISKRNINRVMKKRYGDTYTVDATMKPEEDVQAPDDDDEEDDDDEDEDDEDDNDVKK